MSHFNEAAAASYLDGPPRQVPGYAGLLRMTALLLAERLSSDARVLVLGAGGGMELKAMADAQPHWSFAGVDPSAPMLRLAGQTVAPHAARVQLHEGYIDAAPEGPFDAATCILTMHFVPREQRLETLRQLRRRLKPGAPFVMAHISFPQTEPDRSLWIARHVAFGAAAGLTAEQMESARQAIGTRLTILSPDEEEALLAEAGFAGISQFYAAFSFRGWVAYG
ncbi:class I SAM-dependent methyltransferase [Devosia sp. Root635]|uniref:class I SAM-dependent methyltransferase n=1 Tax=Devosia sp. Root635 TaxID=1736575 RepID=UPI0006F8203D|nr:class I SAM-dependent methyltransferase [Devosia sp. Root635]KRA42239.1 methyltransferase [Devosia sp. Root635]